MESTILFNFKLISKLLSTYQMVWPVTATILSFYRFSFEFTHSFLLWADGLQYIAFISYQRLYHQRPSGTNQMHAHTYFIDGHVVQIINIVILNSIKLCACTPANLMKTINDRQPLCLSNRLDSFIILSTYFCIYSHFIFNQCTNNISNSVNFSKKLPMEWNIHCKWFW